MSDRQQRKLDHVRLAAAQPAQAGGHRSGGGLPAPGWEDVHLVHRSLPERALAEIDLTTQLAGVRLPCPVLINAMTGGAEDVARINRDLGAVAAELGLAIAVGSQTAGLREPAVAGSYRVVRQANPTGVVLANIGAGARLEEARAAVEMVEANLLQVHLNAPQELVMPEGDRDFRGQLESIAILAAKLPVPVVAKECGFGLARETVQELYAAGVRAVDVSGRGGTNFTWIEARRGDRPVDPGLEQWGIPTAATLAEVSALGLPGLDIVASGGIQYGSEAAKALALGAAAVGVAGAVLRVYLAEGITGAHSFLEQFRHSLRCAMLLAGAATVAEMRRRPVVITGEIGQWCRLRGVPVEAWANR